MEQNKKSILNRWLGPNGDWFNLLLLPLLAAWLYTLSVLIHNYWSAYSSFETTAESFNSNLRTKEQSFFDQVSDSLWLQQIISRKFEQAEVDKLKTQPFKVFLYKLPSRGSAQLVFWSSNEVQPGIRSQSAIVNGDLLSLGNGYYEQLFQRVKVGGDDYLVVGLIHLYRQYRIENTNLTASFPGQPRLNRYFKFQEQATAFPILNFKGEEIAYLKKLQSSPPYTSSIWEFVLQLISLVLVLYFFSQLWLKFIRRGRPVAGFTGMAATWAILFFVLPSIGELLDWQSLLPDENKYLQSSAYDLIDLVYRTAISLWWLVVLSFEWSVVKDFIRHLKLSAQWLLVAIFILFGVGIQFALVKWINILYLDLGVAFDVTNFFSLDYTTILGFMFLFLALSVHLLYFAMVVPLANEIAEGKKIYVAALAFVSGLAILTAELHNSGNTLMLASLAWLVLVVMGLLFYRFSFSPVRTSSSIVWIFIYALSFGLLMTVLSGDRLTNKTKELSKGLILQQDKSSEYLIRVASIKLRRLDWPGYYQYIRNKADYQRINDSLISQFFGGYLDRFSTEIYLFDASNKPIGGATKNSFETMNLLFNSSKADPSYPWLASYEVSYDRFGYVIRFTPQTTDSVNIGTVFSVTRSILPFSDDFAPEFLRQLIDINTNWPRGFSYAWYNKGVLINQYRSYPFPAELEDGFMTGRDEKSIDTENAYEWWQIVPPENMLAVAGNKNIAIGYVSLVSYLFSSFLIIFLIFRMTAWLIPSGRHQKRFFNPFEYSIQNRLRVTIVGILIASFFIIALVTINFFIGQFKENNEEALSININAATKQLQEKLPQNFADYSINSKAQYLQRNLRGFLGGNDYDLNFFDTSGNILATTQDVIYAREILAELINPQAFWLLQQGESFRFFANENIGSLNYLSVYQPLRNKNNQLMGYLQVPYFASNNVLKEEIAGFVVVLVNVIAFVFLLSGFIAILASGNITKSLNLISEKMNRLNLSGENERIEWQGNDEIGKLVAQYNKTVVELENSARMLAKNEREMAWRDMARQVAHEIKNPLTPMKLSLQFLQNAIASGRSDVDTVTLRVAKNLVVQIDHLARIAFEFSEFANIGTPQNEPLDLHRVMESIIPLYHLQDGIKLKWIKHTSPLMVYADATQMNRLFTNLLQNAVEACNGMDNATITVTEKVLDGNTLFITIADNGSGIPAEMKAKIFVPNFTTKSSGTGLGLAICKAIVEKADGAITFTSEVGEGTVFRIQLPLMVDASFTSRASFSVQQ